MKTKHYILISIIILFFSLFSQSCTKCTEYPRGLRAYYPYAIETKIIYKNEFGDTLAFYVTDVAISSKHYIPGLIKCLCRGSLHFHADSDSSHTMRLSGYSNADVGYSLAWYFLTENAENRFVISEQDAAFGDTLKLANPDNHQIDSIIIIKNKGLILFHDKENNCTWQLNNQTSGPNARINKVSGCG